MTLADSKKSNKREWHYKPELPLRVSPLFYLAIKSVEGIAVDCEILAAHI